MVKSSEEDIIKVASFLFDEMKRRQGLAALLNFTLPYIGGLVLVMVTQGVSVKD